MKMTANASHAIITFIKNPVLGKVKTRLAKTIGDEAALAAYKQLLNHTRSVVIQSEAKAYLFYDQQIQKDDFLEKDFHKKLQHPGDLGARINHAFNEVFQNNHTKVLIIGSDCPDINPEIISEAFASLDEHDFCIGPTEDQGYYLLGMKEMQSFPFEGISWSTEKVLSQTKDKIKGQNKTCAILKELYDVDFEKEWKRSHLYRKVK